MNPGTKQGERIGRRAFLAAAGAAGVAALAGCTVTMNDGGITIRPANESGGDGGGAGTPAQGPDPAASGGTPEPTPEPVMLDPVTVEQEPPEVYLVTPEGEPTPTPTAAPTPTPDLGPSRVRVHDVSLKVVSANDGDVFVDDEELFGAIWIRGFDDRSGYFETDTGGVYGYLPGIVHVIERENPLVIEEGKTKGLNIDEVVTFSDPAGLDRDASYVSVGASLHEKDGADDDLGDYHDGHDFKWRLSDAGTVDDGEVNFHDGGTHVRLTFAITPLD